MTKLYVAKFSYGKAHLSTAELVKETPRIYRVERSTKGDLLGWQFLPDRLYKSKHHCFLTAEEALDYLLVQAHLYINDLEAKLVRAKDTSEVLAQIKKELKGAA